MSFATIARRCFEVVVQEGTMLCPKPVLRMRGDRLDDSVEWLPRRVDRRRHSGTAGPRSGEILSAV